METQNHIIERLIAVLLPGTADDKRDKLGDTSERHLSSREYILEAHTVYCVVRSQIRRAFDIRLLAGEAGVLYISFAVAPVLPSLILIAVALGALLLRDGYIHPAKGSPDEAATDAIVAATFIVAAQVLLGLAAPALALPAGVIVRGTAIGMLAVSTWRMIFRMKSPSMEPPGPAVQSYQSAQRMNALWIAATIALIFMNTGASPAQPPVMDFLLGAIPVVVLGIAHRLRLNRLGEVAQKSAPLSLSGDAHKHVLSVKKRRLLCETDQRTLSKFPWSQILENLFFVLLALPLAVTLWIWFSGQPQAASIDWTQTGANLGAFVTLLALWVYIKKLNRRAARALQNEIDERDASQKK